MTKFFRTLMCLLSVTLLASCEQRREQVAESPASVAIPTTPQFAAELCLVVPGQSRLRPEAPPDSDRSFRWTFPHAEAKMKRSYGEHGSITITSRFVDHIDGHDVYEFDVGVREAAGATQNWKETVRFNGEERVIVTSDDFKLSLSPETLGQ